MHPTVDKPVFIISNLAGRHFDFRSRGAAHK
jgi:hypothetical protein